MPIATRLVLLAVCCIAPCWANDVDWEWGCEPVTGQEQVDMDKVEGRWYIVEVIMAGVSKNEHNCGVLDILSTSDPSRLLFQYHTWLTYYNDRYYRIKNVFVTVLSPSHWLAAGSPNMVVDQPADANTLAVSYCNEGQRTIVYSRTNVTDLHGIHERLQSTGVLGLAEAKPYNRSGCPSTDIINSIHNATTPCNYIDGYCVASSDTHTTASFLVLLLPLLRMLFK